MSTSPAKSSLRAVRWLAPAAALALVPKCLLCVLTYAGIGAALGLGGPEICGAPSGSPASWPWSLALLGLTIGSVAALVARRRRRARRTGSAVRHAASAALAPNVKRCGVGGTFLLAGLPPAVVIWHMLELRPTCEQCNQPLPPASTEARICSYECTFCADCAERVLGNVCPNCGGGFTPRPIRPVRNWKGNNYLGADPASTTVKHRPVDLAAHAQFAAEIRLLPPEQR